MLQTTEPIDPIALHDALVSEAATLRASVVATRDRLAAVPDQQVAATLELQGIELVQLERAIARHEAGLWDRCERCDTRIREERLQVLPTAVTCGPCAMQGAS